MTVAKYESNYTGAQVDDAVDKRHTQNTDTILDEGGDNEVSAAEIVQDLHTQNTDTILDEGGDNEVTAEAISDLIDADRTVLVSALRGYHDVPLSITGTSTENLSRLFSLEEDSRYLIEIFGQVIFENASPALTTNATGISQGIVYRADASSTNYTSLSTFLQLSVSAGSVQGIYLSGEFVTGSSPSLQFQYEREGNPGGDAGIYHFTVKLTKLNVSDLIPGAA